MPAAVNSDYIRSIAVETGETFREEIRKQSEIETPTLFGSTKFEFIKQPEQLPVK